MRRWLIVLLLLLAGCGGGTEVAPMSTTVRQSTLAPNEADGAKSARAKKPRVKKPKKPSGVTKQLQAGDAWHYVGTGTATNLDTRQTIPITVGGTGEILSAAVTSPQNVSCKVAQFTMVLTANGLPAVVTSQGYFTQDANGNIFDHGKRDTEGNVRWITTPASGKILEWKSPMQVGDAWGDESIRYSDGTAGRSSNRVARIERVRLVGAVYRAFRVETTSTEGSLTSVGTNWFVPAIGASVREIGIGTDAQQRITIRADISLVPQGSRFQRVPVGQENPELKRWARLVLQMLQH